MWERARLRSLIVVLVALKVVGLVLLFDWSQRAIDVFDLPKSLFSRSIEWLILGLLLIALLEWGSSIVPRSRLHFFVAALVVAYLAAAVTAEDRYVALFGERGRYLGLTFLIDMLVLYAAVAVAFRTIHDWAILSAAVGVAVIVSGAYAWVQFAGLDPIAWQVVGSESRPFSTVGNPNTYGHFLSVALGPAAGLAVLYAGRWSKPVRLIAGGLTFGILVTAGIVATRGAVLGIAAAFVLVPVLAIRSYGVTRRHLTIAAGAMLAAAALTVVIVVLSPLGGRLEATLRGFATRDRLLVYEGALEAFGDRPILGYGPDNFGVVWPRYRPPDMARLVGFDVSNNSAHDWVLQAAATTGGIGLFALLALVVAGFVLLIKRGLPASPLIASLLLLGAAGYWAHALVSVGTVGVDWVPWLTLGGTASLVGTTATPSRARATNRIVVGGVMVAAVLVAATGLRAFEANRDAFRARLDSDTSQAVGGLEFARAAILLDDGRADYWNELGRAYFASAKWQESAGAFNGAIARAPQQATYRSNLAKSLTQLALTGGGSADAAAEAARQAVRVDPNSPVPYVALAEVLSALKQPDDALQAIVNAIRLFPGHPRFEAIAAAAARDATDVPAARRALADAIAVRDSATLRVALGQLALKQGDREAALANGKRALELDPRNAEAMALVRAAS